MKRRARSIAPRRSGCAPRGTPSGLPLALLLGIVLTTAVALPLARASDSQLEQPLGWSGIFLQSGLPNRTHQAGPFATPYSENAIVGATRLYQEGYTGSRAVMANIEAGRIWSGHEALAHMMPIPTSGSALGEVDRHATWVGMVMGGRQGGANPGPYQQGIAPDAQLFSGAIATSWSGTRWTGGFGFSYVGSASISTYGPYRAAFMTGLTTPGGLRTADVINSSWGGNLDFFGTAGTDQVAGVLDALAAANPRTLHVAAAGNAGAGPNKVQPPASGFNNISVAALAFNNGTYNVPTTFSSGGPNHYQDPQRFVTSARQVVDIAAPGQNFSTAYYGGETGGNSPVLGGSADGPAGGPTWYTHSVSGTSFAAPTVAGGAALLYDAAYDRFAANPHARDARVIKAVLMNSADKTQGWDNGQLAHSNGNGGVFTTQGLDNRVGTGRLNLDRAFDQFRSGTTDVPGTFTGLLGTVEAVGWDYGLVAQGIVNEYLFEKNLRAGTPFTATLAWFRDRQPVGTTDFRDASYDNLDLELWKAVGGTASQLISASASRYNNSEHFHFTVPAAGQYMLRVRWTEELFHASGIVNNSELYGLAWAAVAVPEPGSLVMMLIAMTLLFCLSRRRL